MQLRWFIGGCGLVVSAAVSANQPAVQDGTTAGESPIEQNWLDDKHQQLGNWLQRQAGTIDNWFGKSDPSQPAKASLRVMVDTTWNEYDGTAIKPRVRGRVKLPTLEQRLSVVFGDDNLDYEPKDGGVLTDERIATPTGTDSAYSSRQTRENNASLALRWSKFRQDTGLDVDLGVRSDDVFVRATADKAWQLPHKIDARFEQMYRYGTKSEHTALSTLQFAKAYSQKSTLINRSHLRYTNQDSENLDWGNSSFMRWQQPVKQGIGELNYGLYAGGDIVDKKARLNTYGPYVSYRQPVWREWLFVQTDVSYYNNKLNNRGHHTAVFGRVEMVF